MKKKYFLLLVFLIVGSLFCCVFCNAGNIKEEELNAFLKVLTDHNKEYRDKRAKELLQENENHGYRREPEIYQQPCFSGQSNNSYCPEKMCCNYSDEIEIALAQEVLKNCPEEIHLFIDCFKYNKSIKNYIPRKLLLVGAPGTGKTTLAKAIAVACQCNYRFIEAPRLLTSFQFSGCENLFNVLNDIFDSDEPCVIIIDEITCLTDRYNNQHFSDKETSAALWLLLDKCEEKSNIFFIGIANDVKTLPEQLKSRFQDSILEIKEPNLESRKNILNYYLYKDSSIKTSVDQSYVQLLAKRTNGFTVRELKKLISKAVFFACKRDLRKKSIIITQTDLEQSLKVLSHNKSLFYKPIAIYIKEFLKDPHYLVFPLISATINLCINYYFDQKRYNAYIKSLTH